MPEVVATGGEDEGHVDADEGAQAAAAETVESEVFNIIDTHNKE